MNIPRAQRFTRTDANVFSFSYRPAGGSKKSMSAAAADVSWWDSTDPAAKADVSWWDSTEWAAKADVSWWDSSRESVLTV